MRTLTEERLLPYRQEELFDLVADVESYPAFLSSWRQARIYRRRRNVYYTDQEIALGPFRDSFLSKTVLIRPKCINVTSFGGVLGNLLIRWEFEPTEKKACRIRYAQTCDPPSIAIHCVAGWMLAGIAQSTVAAFEKRAHEQYGTS